MFGRKKLAMLVAEFLGVAVLTSVVLAVSRSPVGVAWFVAVTAGLTNALLIMALGAVSGAHVNPAVTLGLFSLRKISAAQTAMYVAAQMLGALVAMSLYSYLADTELVNIAGNSYDWRVVAAEVTGAFIFTFAIAAAVFQKFEGPRLAFSVGAGLTIGLLVASVGSNAVLNPAVALGIQSWGMAYVLGPVVGAVLGMNVYSLMFTDTGIGAWMPAKKTNKKRR